MSGLYERLLAKAGEGVEEVLDSKPFAQAVQAALNVHKPRQVTVDDVLCEGCQTHLTITPHDQCQTVQAMAWALGIDP